MRHAWDLVLLWVIVFVVWLVSALGFMAGVRWLVHR
jgi:hypothetical protein